MVITWVDLIGIVGSLIVVVGYWLTTSERLKPCSYAYFGMNIAAALLLTVSLIKNFNVGSLLIEVFWFTISIHGVWKLYRKGKTNE